MSERPRRHSKCCDAVLIVCGMLGLLRKCSACGKVYDMEIVQEGDQA